MPRNKRQQVSITRLFNIDQPLTHEVWYRVHRGRHIIGMIAHKKPRPGSPIGKWVVSKRESVSHGAEQVPNTVLCTFYNDRDVDAHIEHWQDTDLTKRGGKAAAWKFTVEYFNKDH